MKAIWSIPCFFLLAVPALAQSDSVRSEMPTDTAVTYPPLPNGLIVDDGQQISKRPTSDTLDWRHRHSPKKATILSAVAPGSGQIYNRRYWKAPIVWAGLGASYWFIQNNNKEFKRYKAAYIAVVDNDPTTVDEFNGQVSSSSLLDVTNTYRKWRDLSYIALGMVYMLNIVDASVDANFVRFDVGRDLTVGVGPSLELAARRNVGLHLSMALR